MEKFSRRDFIKISGASLGALTLSPHLIRQFNKINFKPQYQIPNAAKIGRNATGGTISVRSAPTENSSQIKTIYEDTLVEWQREVVGVKEGNYNQRWIETPEGYVYSGAIQPVENHPNTPMEAIPNGQIGFWAEVTVPYVDLFSEKDPSSPWAKGNIAIGRQPRLYFSQVVWIDSIAKSSDGHIIYRFNENAGRPAGFTGGGYGDLFWADGAAFRPLTPDDISPISPNVDPADKKVVVNLTYQTLQCFEKKNEVYFCRISSGAGFDAYGNIADEWLTPLGEQMTWRKTFSIHMSAGTAQAGYDTPAVSWVSFFNGAGVAIHSAFWHNLFGEKKSHGCVNTTPQDAKWIFRWMSPVNTFDQSDIQMDYPNGGTHVVVQERQY